METYFGSLQASKNGAKEATAVARRYCRIGKCIGNDKRTVGECLSQKPCTTTCLDMEVNGRNYIGEVSVDYKGRPCVPWTTTLIGRKFFHKYRRRFLGCTELLSGFSAKFFGYLIIFKLWDVKNSGIIF